jgi:uncharacterized membrane protein YqaE (UPF0057 family)
MKQRAIQRDKKKEDSRNWMKFVRLVGVLVFVLIPTVVIFSEIAINRSEFWLNFVVELLGLGMAVLYIEFFYYHSLDEWVTDKLMENKNDLLRKLFRK